MTFFLYAMFINIFKNRSLSRDIFFWIYTEFNALPISFQAHHRSTLYYLSLEGGAIDWEYLVYLRSKRWAMRNEEAHFRR